ncbi:MAG: hypothetical protein K6F76_03600 [Clostridiales bacterium]|nr:hypothetical protein [Clostridiales bacterium]
MTLLLVTVACSCSSSNDIALDSSLKSLLAGEYSFTPGQDDDICLSFYNNIAVAEGGYYFTTFEHHMLYYFDKATKKVVPVCNRPECSHDSTDCNAYIGEIQHYPGLWYYDGKLYVLGYKSGIMGLYTVSKDGSEHSRLCDLSETGHSLHASCNGWYIRHIKNLFSFCNEHFELLSKPVQRIFDDVSSGYTVQWKKRVGHFSVPIFARNTKSAWGTRFDDVIADALESGPLRTEEYVLPIETKQKLDELEIPNKCKRNAEDLTAFYYTNKQVDCDWVILPIVNFNAYYHSTTFEKNYLPQLPKNVFIRETIHGLCRFKVVL